jgi:hypothetical protein
VQPLKKMAWLSPILLFFSGLTAATPPGCAPPSGFKDLPPPEIAPIAQLVSHTEEVIVNRPLGVVLEEVEPPTSIRPFAKAIRFLASRERTKLTSGGFGQPGSHRLVCLTDGSTTVEQVLENKRDKTSAEFRYVVWNYTSEKARPMVYGVGHFVRTDLGDGRTRVVWTYSFQLNRQRFPGYLGSFGNFLFRVGFLDREYAQMMRRTLGKE